MHYNALKKPFGVKLGEKKSGRLTGVFTSSVTEGGPTTKCGIKKGNTMLQVNDHNIEGYAYTFLKLQDMATGGKAKFVMFRHTEEGLTKARGGDIIASVDTVITNSEK